MNFSRVIYILLLLFAFGFFFRNIYRLVATLCLGQWENRFDRLGLRLKNMLVYAFGQARVIKKSYGFNHFFIFWGFMLLLMANGEFLIQGVFPGFSWSFLGDYPYGALLFLAEIMSAVVILAVVTAVIRRLFFRPAYIEFNADAFLILGMIFTLMVAYYGYHAGEIALGAASKWASWMFVSNAIASFIQSLSVDSIHAFTNVSWWIHAIVLLFFMNYLPYSKHLHVLTAIPNCFFRRFEYPSVVPTMEFKQGDSFGKSKITQFSWKDLLDFMSCTECGRCQENCPAHVTGKSLNPKHIIHQGKVNLFKNSKPILASRPSDTLGPAPDDAVMDAALIGDDGAMSISATDLWQCTTCGSCMTHCPVFIEHVPKIIQMRQYMVMEKSEFPEELIQLFENSEQRSNPWGIAPTDRAKWTEGLDVPILTPGDTFDYLFYVGCAGSYDSRAKSVVTSMTKILNTAGVSWGILGNEEHCCGDSVRRAGNEYVFSQMARFNVNQFHRYGVKKIITMCPHGYSTIKNDYQQFGGDFEVIHHTEFINQLLDEGKLPLKRQETNGTTVYHDSCYLGRYNNIYKAPRQVLSRVNGNRLEEMDRCGESSFCCGAGGAKMWMEEPEGKYIYLERTEEAMRKNPSTIAVACPFCMTMFEDGVKEAARGKKVVVRDIAEIVANAMEDGKE
ncbi:MAG: heterodisulfide reductase-related iron-sulfur binding cluster [Candidatus Hinthialibacter antarcticus]|nr:heterodisulfide reductase-related iron-sulfur binding cluster [Candidatus Hinthialibacter antarcticus]